MTSEERCGPTAADIYVRTLAERGVDYIFANAGTDFPSIIEALARAAEQATPAPKAVAVPHENLAVAMAYGHTMVSGRPQAVMLHVNVGTANAICGLLNAARERIPMLVAAGRTPYSEAGHAGSRSIFIHWAQEMFDQAAMLREIVKWDYELKLPEQTAPALDRALSLAMSEPSGPVYLTLPREVLAAAVAADGAPRTALAPTRAAMPDAAAIAEAAALLARAERPLIVTSSLGRDPAAVALLAALAERWAFPVVSHFPKSLCLPTDHPMHLGFDPAPFLKEADAILVLECDVPWIPARAAPGSAAKLIHLAVDPLFGRYPMRGFPSDLTIGGNVAAGLRMLEAALADEVPRAAARIAARRERLIGERAAQLKARAAFYERVRHERPLHPVVVSRALDRVKGEDAILVNELGAGIETMSFTKPGTYFAASPAGGLGWGLGAALGAKLAASERLVIATVGDGSYMFGNPTPAHYVARAHELPVLFVVFNNGGWAAVRKATEAMYPEGRSSRMNRMPLATLEPSPAFEKVIEASGGHGERVEREDELVPAFERALEVVKAGKRQALVNVMCGIQAVRHF
ncbi:MAG TPA: thiamine pyrophosphate-requiring protein [Alphaproteobacteria bacterium]|nr:thiamine pyrophosphate-requiring protein [Alphaproteobacteria bacterium]